MGFVVHRCLQSAADTCRERGWTVGTHLEGDEGYGPDIIVITAVGEHHILAKQVTDNGKPFPKAREGLWTLSCRDWREVSPPQPAGLEQGEG